MRRSPDPTKRHTVAYFGPYPPSRSNAALFTLDLVNATDLFGWQSVVIAVEDLVDQTPAASDHDTADHKVVAEIVPDNAASYAAAAQLIQRSDISVACLHYGPDLYHDAVSSYLPTFARLLDCPVVVVLHEVDGDPSDSFRGCIDELSAQNATFIVLAHSALRLLTECYGLPADRTRYIPHGAPIIDGSPEDRIKAKQSLGLADRRVLTTFGRLGPSKGIEYVLHALADIAIHHSNVLYLILAAPPPRSQSAEAEPYRRSLEAIARDLGIEGHVRFIDEFLGLRRLIEFLKATDIYVHAVHSEPEKITPGALPYAFAAGNVIVSTPIPYAQELLAHRRGYLVPFQDSRSLAIRITDILSDPSEFDTVRRRAYAHGRGMTWEEVGLKYVELFDELASGDRRNSQDKPAHRALIRGVPPTALWEHARMNDHESTEKEVPTAQGAPAVE